MDTIAFITKSNFKSIISNLEEIGLDETIDKANLYKWPVFFLSSFETDKLFKQREFLKDPENIISVYKRRNKIDTKQYIYEGLQPAYHAQKNCGNLQSKYRNYEIPEEIKERGEEEIKKFRSWFKLNQNYLESKPDLFIAKMQIAFNLSTVPTAVDYDNTGATEFDNLNLDDLEDRIDSVLRAAGNFYKDNPDKQSVIKRFQKFTYLAYKNEEIRNNDTELTDTELKSFLFEYDYKFKKPFKDLLLQYYMVRFNPDLKFNGLLLEQLGFRKCKSCF